jgi:hypothetical protein
MSFGPPDDVETHARRADLHLGRNELPAAASRALNASGRLLVA